MSARDRTITELTTACIALHNTYLPFRNEGVPFPPESLAFWCFLLNLQTSVGVQGKLLELGVQHGGTAFLSILSMYETDQQILVDLHQTDLFAAKFANLPAARQKRTEFIEAPTGSASTDHLLDQNFRFIHIDAGHTYDLVKADMERFAPTVQDNGIVCCDDFFINRWPDVTLAILDSYQSVGLLPVALVNRKAYFAKSEYSEELRAIIRDHSAVLSAFGQLNHWDVTLRGSPVDYYRIAPLATVGRAPI